MELITAVFIIILTSIMMSPLIKTYLKCRRIAKYIDVLPGEKKYPIIGTSLRLFNVRKENYFELMRSRHIKFGPFIRDWHMTLPAVRIYKPEHVQVILNSNTNIKKGMIYKFLTPWLGQGLLTGTGPHWRKHRKIITPAFHFKILDDYADVFAEKGATFAKFLERYAGKGYFEITEHIHRLGTDVLAETSMGVKLNFLEETEGKGPEYANAIAQFATLAIQRLYNPLYRSDFIFNMTKNGKKSQNYVKLISEFNSVVINKRKEYMKIHGFGVDEENDVGQKRKMSFLDILLLNQENSNMDDKEIEEEVNTFMFTGIDTTGAAMTYTLMALGNYPEILRKVQNEIDTIFADDPDRKVTPQDINQMEYFDRVIKEVLRCYNFIPFLTRELEEDVQIGEHIIPKGVNITIDSDSLHHDPEYYPDPYKFDPDRFLPENVASRHPYSYVPFSAGPRNCIGKRFGMRNIKTILTSILRKYNVKCQEKPEDLKFYLDMLLWPQKGLHISLELRR